MEEACSNLIRFIHTCIETIIQSLQKTKKCSRPCCTLLSLQVLSLDIREFLKLAKTRQKSPKTFTRQVQEKLWWLTHWEALISTNKTLIDLCRSRDRANGGWENKHYACLLHSFMHSPTSSLALVLSRWVGFRVSWFPSLLVCCGQERGKKSAPGGVPVVLLLHSLVARKTRLQ